MRGYDHQKSFEISISFYAFPAAAAFLSFIFFSFLATFFNTSITSFPR